MTSMSQRYKSCLAARVTHPYVKWVTLGHAGVKPACRELEGRVFAVESTELRELVRKHARCGCRLAPMPALA